MPFSDHFKGAVHHHKRFRIDIEDNVFSLGSSVSVVMVKITSFGVPE